MPTNSGPPVTGTYTLPAGVTAPDAGAVPQLVVASGGGTPSGPNDVVTGPLVAGGVTAPNVVAGDAAYGAVTGQSLALTGNYPYDVAQQVQATQFRFALSVGGQVVYTPWTELDFAPVAPSVQAQLSQIQAAIGGIPTAPAIPDPTPALNTLTAKLTALQSSVGAIQPPSDGAIRSDIQAEMQALGVSPTAIASAVMGASVDGTVTAKQMQELVLAYMFGTYASVDTPAVNPTTRTIVFHNQAGQMIATSTDALVGGRPTGRASVAFANLAS